MSVFFAEEEALLFPHEVEVLQRLVADREALDKEVNALRWHALQQQKKADLCQPLFGGDCLKEQLRYGRSQRLCALYGCVCVVHLFHMPQCDARKITREQFLHKYVESPRERERERERDTRSAAHTHTHTRTQ